MDPVCHFNLDYAPIFLVTLRGAPSDQQYESLFAEFAVLTKRLQPFALVFDARRAKSATAKQRSFAIDYTKMHGESSRLFCTCLVLLQDSPLVAGVLTALTWVHKMPFAMKATTSVAETTGFAASVLAERGVPMPAERLESLNAHLAHP